MASAIHARSLTHRILAIFRPRSKDGKQTVMSTGAERAEPRESAGWIETEPAGGDWIGTGFDQRRSRSGGRPRAPATPASAGAGCSALPVLLLAVGWIAAVVWQACAERGGADAGAAGSLRRHRERAAGAARPRLAAVRPQLARRDGAVSPGPSRPMRGESVALETVLGIVAEKLEENHGRLRGEAEKLMSLGDEAADRLGRVTYYLSKETASLDRTAPRSWKAPPPPPRSDIGVLMHDLPRAEEQARAVADAMKEAGLAAHGQAGALEAPAAALAARGREADEVLGGAAQQMAAPTSRESKAARDRGDGDGRSLRRHDRRRRRGDGPRRRGARRDARGARGAGGGDLGRDRTEQRRARPRRRSGGGEPGRRASTGRRDDRALGANLAATTRRATARRRAGGGGRGARRSVRELGRTGGDTGDRLARRWQKARAGSVALIEALGGGRGEADALLARAGELRAEMDGVTGELERRVGPRPFRGRSPGRPRRRALAALGEAAAGVDGSARSIEQHVEAVAARVAEVAPASPRRMRRAGAGRGPRPRTLARWRTASPRPKPAAPPRRAPRRTVAELRRRRRRWRGAGNRKRPRRRPRRAQRRDRRRDPRPPCGSTRNSPPPSRGWRRRPAAPARRPRNSRRPLRRRGSGVGRRVRAARRDGSRHRPPA